MSLREVLVVVLAVVGAFFTALDAIGREIRAAGDIICNGARVGVVR